MANRAVLLCVAAAALLSGATCPVEAQTRSPSATADFDPLIGQPSLAIQAAKLARLPLAPTLDMLSFLMPQGGTGLEQPPFYCERELVPILRHWMKLAAAAPPEKHAAALLLADQVARRVSECAEFDEEPPNPAFPSDEARDTAQQVLLKDLHGLGIETQHPAHMGYEYYVGNLLPLAHKLAPAGRAEELNGVAVLNQRCVWSAINDADCAEFIQQGEAFLKRYPNDEWTPSIHLVLAEAYSITLGQDQWSTEADTAADAAMTRAAIAHLGAWYAHNGSEQTRAVVWQEIWDLQAGLGPWLMVPSELRR